MLMSNYIQKELPVQRRADATVCGRYILIWQGRCQVDSLTLDENLVISPKR